MLYFSCFRGFGFITFGDPASVDKVLAQGTHELDGKKVSKILVLKYAYHYTPLPEGIIDILNNNEHSSDNAWHSILCINVP